MLERGVNHYRVRLIEFGMDLQEAKIKWLYTLSRDLEAPEKTGRFCSLQPWR